MLKKSGYNMNWRQALVLVYGGLRGAVGLTLALIVSHEKKIDQHVRDLILFHTAMIACATLLINGTTTGFVLEILKMIQTSTWKEITLIRIA